MEVAETSGVEELLAEPNFAVICSFFNKFSTALVLKPLSFDKLQSILTFDKEENEQELVDLHVKLLKKIGHKSANVEKWENYLLKFCSVEPSLVSEYFQLERFGYIHTSVVTKLKILKCLCDRQFDWNLKFREQISEWKSVDLRVLPVGVDRNGLAYWCQLDAEFNLRLYGGEQDDNSGATWQLRAKTRDELYSLIEELQRENGTTEQLAEVKSEEIKIESDQISAKAEEKTEAIPNKLPVGAVGKKGRFMDTFQGEIECKTEPKPVVEEKTSESSASSVTAEQQQVKVDLQPEVSQSSTEEKSEPKGELNGHESEDERLARLISESEVSGRRILPPRSKRWKLGESLVTKKPKSDSDSEKSAAESSQSSAEENQSELSSDESDYQPLSRFKRNPSGKRQKRVKKERKEESSDEDEVEQQQKERKVAQDDTLCQMCKLSSNPELLLLCDKCDAAWHTFCLKPVLWFVPDDDWFCPKCQQLMLTEKLQEALKAVDEYLAKKAIEEKKSVRIREKRERSKFTAISSTNIIEDSGPRVKRTKVTNVDTKESEESELEEDENEETTRKDSDEVEEKSGESAESEEENEEKSHRHRHHKNHLGNDDYYWPPAPLAKTRTRREVKTVDYSFKEFDEMIQEAVLETDKKDYRPVSVRPSGAGRGKDMANILEATGVIKRERELQQQQKAVDSQQITSETLVATESVTPMEESKITSDVKLETEEGDDGDDVGEESETEDNGEEIRGGKPPAAALDKYSAKTKLSIKHRRKLNDLDVDNMTESDSEEYKATSSEDEEEEEVESDWAEAEGVRRSSRVRTRGKTQSDEDFVVSGSDWEEEEMEKSRGRGRNKRKTPVVSAKKKKGRKRYADSSSSESEISRGTPQSDESESDPEFRPTKKKSSKPAERRRHVPPPKRPKLTKPKGKSANKSPVAELNSELSVGGRSLRTRGTKVNYKALLNPDLGMKLTDNDSEEETAVEEKKKAKLDLRNFVRTPEVDKEKEIESEAGESSGEETELKIRSRNRILHSSEDEETEEKIVIKTAVQTTSNEVKQASTTVISSGGNVSQTIIPPISSSIAVTSVAPIIPQVPTATPVDPLAALHSMVPNGSNVNTTLQPSLPSRGIPAPVIVGPERSGFLPYTHLYQPQPTGYYGNFPPPPANLYQPANFACPPHSPFTSARTPYIMGPSGYPTVGPNVFLPPPQSQPPQFHPQMAYGEKFQSSQPTQFVQENEGNSSRANAEGTLTDILSCAIRDSE